jgi:hypothetical protein
VTDPLTLAPGWPPQLERSSRQARPPGRGHCNGTRAEGDAGDQRCGRRRGTFTYELDSDGTEKERERIREERVGWLDEDPEGVAERYREGELDTIDHWDG